MSINGERSAMITSDPSIILINREGMWRAHGEDDIRRYAPKTSNCCTVPRVDTYLLLYSTLPPSLLLGSPLIRLMASTVLVSSA